MAAESARAQLVEQLTESELRALVAGATWYAKYHEPIIAEHADDESALGVARREHFEDLHLALRKLGVRLRPPAGIKLAS